MTRELLVEADGGSRGNPGPAGYGAVVKDAVSGRVLAETAAYIGRATNNVAEYRGLIAGLRAAHALAPTAAVRVRMDSKLVVEQMSGRWKIKHPDMRPLALEAKQIYPAGAVRFEWIPRERNKHADRLANEAMDAGRRGEEWRPGGPATSAEATATPPPLPPPVPGIPRTAQEPAREPGHQPTPAGRAAQEPAAARGWGPGTGTPTTLLLLRHGETALTARKRFSGSGGQDPELTEVGRAQAASAAAALASVGVGAVVSSPLRRCRQTAEAVATRLNLDVRVEDGLRETDFGAWEGLTFEEIGQRHPEELRAWLESAEARPGGDGESFATVARRVAVARDKTLARFPGRTVLVVTHVTPVKTLVRLALGAPPAAMFRMELSPAAVCEIGYYPDGNATVRRFNDTAHLGRPTG
ncbi:bifunctional RNase H/acid phosphatase [Streptomyces sp. DSM 44915]|uniref:Bifunctional RNase H/acid phosphatase n=1 Tax=Streptomyces chisholmiae TaxID=3075540 RepID=A0ABU2JP21_9ACTN|nr:bifunctional RNase H/acid phosphatase [Streptomyces sp. DSM 44915]MDT0266740.1 bifunctional RNase H/acid phosphatase [Streptomyces sp. DSM 44915]